MKIRWVVRTYDSIGGWYGYAAGENPTWGAVSRRITLSDVWSQGPQQAHVFATRAAAEECVRAWPERWQSQSARAWPRRVDNTIPTTSWATTINLTFTR